ncbi:helix-turn-helix domain-containing protein [Streptomyces sp. NBC_00012]|uniref:helix-turn-helix domain-containing protein n=1 Tax=Streptomyces sp. NBC_00012 TaxID=2975621 RepID=UPI00386AF63B
MWHVPARVAERARIVLVCAEGASNTRVPADYRVSTETVRKWHSRSLTGGWHSARQSVRS